MNGVVAFVEEHQAANAIAALKQRLAASARVLRDGRGPRSLAIRLSLFAVDLAPYCPVSGKLAQSHVI